MKRLENEQRNWIDEPMALDEEYVDDILQALGNQIQFHHTVRWHSDMTYGGLHNTSQEAAKGFKNFDFSNIKKEAPKALQNGDAFVVYLREGEGYLPWGSGGSRLTHGVNDGTHGGRQPSEIARKVL